MVSFQKKFSFFKVNESWFRYRFTFWDIFSMSCYMHLKGNEKVKIFGIKDISHTVELNLEQEAETIFSNFSSSVRSDIKKSEKEGVVCEFKNDIDAFVKFYNDFASGINISLTSRKRIEEMGESFVMSFAYSGNDILAAHSYLVDDEIGIARQFHSASKRFDENFDRKLIGRANKLLTYQDILHFKNKGFKTFDFGGIAENTTDKSLAGINEFKLSFGGQKAECINYSSFGYNFLKKLGRRIGATGNG